jgi:hypothetical protein
LTFPIISNLIQWIGRGLKTNPEICVGGPSFECGLEGALVSIMYDEQIGLVGCGGGLQAQLLSNPVLTGRKGSKVTLDQSPPLLQESPLMHTHRPAMPHVHRLRGILGKPL